MNIVIRLFIAFICTSFILDGLFGLVRLYKETDEYEYLYRRDINEWKKNMYMNKIKDANTKYIASLCVKLIACLLIFYIIAILSEVYL